MEVLRYIAAMLETVLPPRYRKDTALRGPAMTCAVAEVVIAVFGLILRLLAFAAKGPGLPANVSSEIVSRYGEAGLMSTGPFVLFQFWFQPFNMVLGYFVFEGMVRFLGALVGHEVIGSLPLYVISGVHSLTDKKKYREYIGELIVDEVARGDEQQGYDLKVYSCRPKLHWNPYMTIEFEGKFYQYFKEEHGPAPRRFIYYLRKNPTGRIVVKIDHYPTGSVLKAPSDRWASTPGVRDKMVPEWMKKPVPDEIIRRKSERQAYDLKIYSCTPKHDWDYHVTIEFEDQLYQMFKEESGPEPRRFVYYLRKKPEGREAYVTRHYKSAELNRDQK